MGRAIAVAGLLVLSAVARPGDPPDLSDDEMAVFDWINLHRTNKRLPVVRPNPKLMEAARAYAANMALQEKVVGVLDDKDAGGRAKAAGYRSQSIHGLLSDRAESGKVVVAQWLRDPTRRKHLENKDVVHAGVGMAVNAKGERYWYLVLAAPADD